MIRAQGLSKLYRLGSRLEFNYTLRDALMSSLKTPRKGLRTNGTADDTIWALKNLDFEVQAGEVVGIIGRNGAGKSTLLKILSGVTEPSEGRAEIYGRIGSLLEVGTGFHPELTGRENIFLNGAILGMKKAEIRQKFEEIVTFAEIEKFLETPVKRYSSGMYMRLAFAVAAHLEPEILLVDEVLAVGDAAFQRKCLAKMSEVAKGGRTVLYVSHNLASLANLCSRAILLAGGRKCAEGPASQVVKQYISTGQELSGERVWPDPIEAPGSEKARLCAVRVISGGAVTSDADIQDDIQIVVDYLNLRPGTRIMISIHVLDQMRVGVLSSANMHSANLTRDEWFDQPHPTGVYRAVCTLPGNFLNEGRYFINALVMTDVQHVEARVDEAVMFNVHDSGAMRKEYGGYWLGVVRPRLAWQTERLLETPEKE
jgi:homopolymeric O-antigen transport system ATP-binding protein